jgi:hypothetical protein
VSLPHEPAGRGGRLDTLLLLALAGVAAVALLATPGLIVPFPAQAPWYESSALFPRVALALVVVGALAELLLRRQVLKVADSDELDSSQARLPLALAMLALFIGYALAVPVLGLAVSTALYIGLCGAVLRLPWRLTLAIAVTMSLGLWVVFVKLLKVAFGHGLLF